MDNEQLNLFSKEDLETKNKMLELNKKIDYYSKKYYEEDISEISDFEFDKLTKELSELELKYPNYAIKNSYTQRVGGNINKNFSAVTHTVQMQSLQDVFSFEDIEEYVQKVNMEYGENTEFIVETKIDGLSVSLEYVEGKLVRGSTRGDGFSGEDITQNLMRIKTIPHVLKSNDTIEIRGEVYLPRKEFEIINEKLELDGKTVLANPRNAAAGTLRQLNPDLVESRNLSIFVFNVLKSDIKFESDIQRLEYLESIGVNTIAYKKVCVGIKEVLKAVEEIGSLRDSLEYDIDGAVININKLSIREEMGSTIKVPKWAIAYKYPPEQKETKILDIITQVGRTGQVTPMAILTPTRVAGSVISKTTLHNFDFIEQKDIRVGDTVIIQKAGDVIPEVTEVIYLKRTGEEIVYKRPTVCPVCSEELEQDSDIVALRCTNSECPATLYRSIVHFASRDCMDINGMGESTVEALLDEKLLEDIADIYYLKYEDVINIERFAPKSTNNLIEAIEKSKKNTLDKLIFGLGIRHIGKKAAKVLATKFSNIYEIAKADEDTINNLDDFGKIMAKSVVEFFKKPKTLEIIDKLQNAGVNLNGVIKKLESNKLEDVIFCITGSFENYSRDEIAKLIEDNSGKVTNTVTKKTNYLISGENAGSKLEKAKLNNINVINIEEFIKLIN